MCPGPRTPVAIMGATATGKSGVAVRLCERFGGEVVSMDSRQVYRGLDIGTAKTGENSTSKVRHHLIDVLDPTEPNSAGWHVGRATEAIEDIAGRGLLPVLAGGTGLYFRVLFEGIIDAKVPKEELESVRAGLAAETTERLWGELQRVDPARARELSSRDRQRILRALEVLYTTGKPHSAHIAAQPRREWKGARIVLTLPRALLRERIAERARRMFEAGWVEEVRGLLASGLSLRDPGLQSLGYRTIAETLLAGRDARSCLDEVILRTQQYAKRQETFFRSVPGARWVDASRPEAESMVEQWVSEVA